MRNSDFTTKHNKRIYVVHNYHDHSNDAESGVSVNTRPFPYKLHMALQAVHSDGWSHVVSWQPHGRCFLVHDSKKFIEEVIPRYFNQTKLTSFQRQLNLYGFQRITKGPDAGGYYHELFLRSKVHLINGMFRTKVKGIGYKAASNPKNEPDFYQMSSVGEKVSTTTPSMNEGGSPSSVTASIVTSGEVSDDSQDSDDCPLKTSCSMVDPLGEMIQEGVDIDLNVLDNIIKAWNRPIESDDQLMEFLVEILRDDDHNKLPESSVSV